MAVEYDPNGTPILTNDSLISDVPPYTQALAAANIMPVGAILPYMSATAPDYWLLCDGSQYDPNDLPELYAVNADFHAPDPHGGVFRVPDFRGRSPVGATLAFASSDQPAKNVSLGSRPGDWRTQQHQHGFSTNLPNEGSRVRILDVGKAGSAGFGSGGSSYYDTGATGWMANSPGGSGQNYQPSTGVNFIVYAGRPTAGIAPVAGGEMPAVTTRMMIEDRLAEAGIGEEEVKMLKEQLENIRKEQDAK